jgi:Ribbon-helix-helix protein, copG family
MIKIASAPAGHERLEDVTLTVHLPEELARRVEALAAARGQSPEQVALEAIEAQLPERRHLSFSGAGSSGQGDIARRHKEAVAEHFAGKTARDL